ncbi:MAG: glutamate-1-semialdehyde 2,1-aminomutase [Deltaproteobacteria bacterium]|nr:glutamate-1-semialdehyde 2,1-aminomutase [Deltaproteobacteria bacterium]
MNHERSRRLFERASGLFPGGVNSPVRAFWAVGGTPVFLARGEGAYVWDADGNRYLDFLGSWGPLLFGHAPPAVVAAIAAAAAAGTTFGASTEREVELGEAIREAFPSMERLRFVSSGTEATMSALRAARGFSGRDKVIKMEGGYHGHADMLLAAAGSGAATLGLPGSAGVTKAAVADTIVVPFNDEAAMRAALAANRGQVAALIVEPIPGNMGLVPPKPGYLEALRRLCDREGTVLIFDEVISGFRAGPGGAQARYGIRPDMTCLGKIVGGGLPLGVYGGRAEIMKVVAPDGPVYQAGTLSGNPLAMAAGLATLRQLRPEDYPRLEALGARLEAGVRNAIAEAGIAACIQRVGSAFTLFFCKGPVTDFASAKLADAKLYAEFFHGMLRRGIYLPPAQLEAAFISLAHRDTEIDAFVSAAHETLAAMPVLR